MGLEDLLGLLPLERNSGGASCLADPAGSRAVDLDLSEEGKLLGRFGEGGNMCAQPDQALLQARRELAWQ
jgi:hypothetical protein